MSDFWYWLRDIFRRNRPTPPQPPLPPPTPTSVAGELLVAHNNERTKAGVSILTLDSKLVTAAEKHAKWMADNELLSHRGSRGSNVASRIRDEGHRPQAMGENIARGYSTVTSVRQGWMSSSGHRRHILARKYKNCGFAKVGRYWCAVFVTSLSRQLVFTKSVSHEPEPLYGTEE